jgi:hypothetical protein
MVRQILEQGDWVLDQSDVKLQSVPFSKATRYRRPDWITAPDGKKSFPFGPPREAFLSVLLNRGPLRKS